MARNWRFAAIGMGIGAATLLAAPVLADQAPPATAPSTQPSANVSITPTKAPTSRPAPVAADQRTPRGAIKVLQTALTKGDAKGLLAVIHTTNPLEERVAKSFAYNVAAKIALRDALESRFPQPGEDAITLESREMGEMMLRIDMMDEAIKGDDATVSINGGGPDSHLELRRVSGQWTIPFSVIFTGLSDVDQRIEQLDIQSRVFNSLAKQLTQGKFQTMDEFQDAGKQQMMTAMLAAATSRPATQPSATMPSVTTQP